jgi:hypothetical protein
MKTVVPYSQEEYEGFSDLGMCHYFVSLCLLSGYLCPSVLVPDAENIKRLAEHISRSKQTGVTSVACGSCVWEYFLTQYFDDVVGIEIVDNRIHQALSKISLRLVCEDTLSLPVIPSHHAMISIFPIPKVPLEEYVSQYTGNCFILLVDHAYSKLPLLKEVLSKCSFECSYDDETVLPWKKAFMVWVRASV